MRNSSVTSVMRPTPSPTPGISARPARCSWLDATASGRPSASSMDYRARAPPIPTAAARLRPVEVRLATVFAWRAHRASILGAVRSQGRGVRSRSTSRALRPAMLKRTIAVMARLVDQKGRPGHLWTKPAARAAASRPGNPLPHSARDPDLRGSVPRIQNAQVVVMPARSKLYWDQVIVPRAARKFGAGFDLQPGNFPPLFTRRPVFVQQDRTGTSTRKIIHGGTI